METSTEVRPPNLLLRRPRGTPKLHHQRSNMFMARVSTRGARQSVGKNDM
jgi:hypothetical protein